MSVFRKGAGLLRQNSPDAPSHHTRLGVRAWLTPACARTTSARAAGEYASTAHPRGRGEHNQLLREAGIEYELGAEGEDLDRLVAVTDDARSDLVHHALSDSLPDTAADVRHAIAIALFRGRDASPEASGRPSSTSAAFLEERRALINEQRGKREEGAPFEIAHRFDLRHCRADQLGEYDEAFLDWIFWWYLGTVE